MSLAGACWLWLQPGDSSGQGTRGPWVLQTSKQPWQRGTEHWGGEGKPAGGFTLSCRLEEMCRHSLLAAPAPGLQGLMHVFFS